MKLLKSAVLCLLWIGNANAYNVLVDFEDSPLDGDFAGVLGPIESRGFSFSGSAPKGVTEWPVGPVDEGKALHWCPGGCADVGSITMTQDGLASFDLFSLDLASMGSSVSIDLIGSFAGGGSISTTVNVTSVAMTNFVLGAGWTNLQSLTIEPGFTFDLALAVDNIAVATAVPVPAAVWLFGSALAGLGWMRRKQTV